MEVRILDRKPYAFIPVLTKSGDFEQQRFLIDTGFNEGCVFIIGRGTEEAQFDLFEIEELPEKEWMVVASGERSRTFKALAVLNLGEKEPVPVWVMEAVERDDPILGIRFLEERERTLHLDFQQKDFYLS